MMNITIGHSEVSDTLTAIHEVLKECQKKLKEGKPQGGILFASLGYEYPIILEEIHKQYPDIQLAGCSSFGEISQGRLINGIVLMLIQTNSVEIRSELAKDIGQKERPSVSNMIRQSLQTSSLKPSMCLVFVDGLSNNASEVIEGIKEGVGDTSLIIAGGGACDEWSFKKVDLFHKHEHASDAASIFMLSNLTHCSIAVRYASIPFP